MHRMGMVAATDVVVSGCSAGAVQTFINTGKYLQTDIFFLILALPLSSSFPFFLMTKQIR